ncbi:MAG: hypothetical protein U0Q14_01310 [Dermatophilaceae bacterium]
MSIARTHVRGGIAAAVLGAAVTLAAGPAAVAAPLSAPAAAEPGRTVLLHSARENAALDRAILPTATLHVGSAKGPAATYVVTESSSRTDAARRGVTWSPKLANARNTGAVQHGRIIGGSLVVDAGVDFAPVRVVVPGPNGFPPATAEPGAIGRPGYSPLVQLPDGTVINAPQVANSTGRADKLLWMGDGRAAFKETEGFYEGRTVYYVSFDASAPDIAALEGVTYAPALQLAPGQGSNAQTSARSGIAPFVNGRTGVDNPERQGLNSALLGEGDPLNVVQTLAGERDYSPLWDVHATVWTDAAKAANADLRQDDFDYIVRLGANGVVTGPGGAAWGAIGVVVNCPMISVVG